MPQLSGVPVHESWLCGVMPTNFTPNHGKVFQDFYLGHAANERSEAAELFGQFMLWCRHR